MIRMKGPIALSLLLTALLLAACTRSDDDVPTESMVDGKQAITFNVNAGRMMDGTRATTIDNNTALQSYDLKIDAYYHGTETTHLNGTRLHYDASSWKFWDGEAQLHYYWPSEGSKTPGGATASILDFVGFCPYASPSYITSTSYNHSTGASFTCNMSSLMTLASQTSMQEYLVAVLNDQTLATQIAAGGALPLVFKHPFAQVKFVITAASGTDVKINSISIAGLYTNATCTYNGSTMTWGSYDEESKAAMTLTQELKNGGTTEGTPFMVIPNDYGTKYLTVNATWDDWSHPEQVTISDYGTNVDFNWEPGYIYTYNLTLDKTGLKVDVAKYTEQW